MIDMGSSVDILYNHAYERMKHKLKAKLYPYDHDVYSYGNHLVKARGIITLPIKLGER